MAKIREYLLLDLIGYDRNRSWVRNSYNFLKSLPFNTSEIKRKLDMHLISRDVFRLESNDTMANLILKKDYDPETYLITNVELDPARRNGHLPTKYSWKDRIEFFRDLFLLKRADNEGIEYMKWANKLESILIKSHIKPEEYSPIKKLVNKYGYPIPYEPEYSFVFGR